VFSLLQRSNFYPPNFPVERPSQSFKEQQRMASWSIFRCREQSPFVFLKKEIGRDG
jgi:hypothetical protein